MRGKQVHYSDELATVVCELLASGQSLRAISTRTGMPSTTAVQRWARTRPEFRTRYEAAQAARTMVHQLARSGSTADAVQSSYSPAAATRVCDAIIAGASMTDLARRRDLPGRSTIYSWLKAKPDFVEMFEAAVELRAEFMADEAVRIADDDSKDLLPGKDGRSEPNPVPVRRASLRIATRKWRLAVIAPTKYGVRRRDQRDDDDFVRHEDALDWLD